MAGMIGMLGKAGGSMMSGMGGEAAGAMKTGMGPGQANAMMGDSAMGGMPSPEAGGGMDFMKQLQGQQGQTGGGDQGSPDGRSMGTPAPQPGMDPMMAKFMQAMMNGRR